MDPQQLNDALDYYREQGAPGDQQMLAALLREVQELSGGVLAQETLSEISRRYEVSPVVLSALIRRVPSLRAQDAPHLLEICSTCAKGRPLAEFAQKACAAHGGFRFRMTPCMKNCKAGPSIRWDGQLYPRADVQLIRRLIEKGK